MNRTAGFSIGIGLVALGVIAFVGLVGWRLLQERASAPNATPSTGPTTEAPSNKYVIGEWHVQFERNSLDTLIHTQVTAKAIYGVEMPADTEAIVFTTQFLAHHSRNCQIGAEGFTPLGTLYKTNVAMAGADALLVKQVGNSFYYYKGPQAVCSNNEETIAIEQQTLAKLGESLKTIEQKN